MQLPLAANALATLGNGAATIGGQQQPQPQQMPQDNPGMLQAQLMQQEQQRKMAQALMGQGYIPNSGGLGALAMVASAWKGKKMQKEADEKIADATKRLFEAQNAEEQRKAAAALQAEIDKENRKFQQDAAMKGIEHGYKERETPNDIKELRLLREDPGLAQHDLVRRRAAASSSTTNITMPGENYAKPFDEALAKQDAQFYTDLRAQSQGAASVINNMNRLETTLKNVPGGKANDVIGQIGQIFGTERGATRDAVEAQVQAAVDKILQLQPGPKTDQDAARARAQIPNMATSAQARKVVFDFIRSGATESQRQFKEADRYAREKGNLYGFTPSPQSPVPQDAVPQRAVNPQTGETVEFRNGTWVKVK